MKIAVTPYCADEETHMCLICAHMSYILCIDTTALTALDSDCDVLHILCMKL